MPEKPQEVEAEAKEATGSRKGKRRRKAKSSGDLSALGSGLLLSF